MDVLALFALELCERRVVMRQAEIDRLTVMVTGVPCY